MSRDDVPRRPVRDSVLLGLGLVAALLLVAAWGSLALAYGASPVPWIAIVVVMIVPAFLLAIPLYRLLAAYLAEPPAYWLLGVVMFVLLVALTGSVLGIANQRYEVDVAASACSPVQLSALQALPFYDASTTPITALDDGGCALEVAPQGSADAALDTVGAGLTQAGWMATPDDTDGRTFTHDALTLVVTPGASGPAGSTSVTLTVAPA